MSYTLAAARCAILVCRQHFLTGRRPGRRADRVLPGWLSGPSTARAVYSNTAIGAPPSSLGLTVGSTVGFGRLLCAGRGVKPCVLGGRGIGVVGGLSVFFGFFVLFGGFVVLDGLVPGLDGLVPDGLVPGFFDGSFGGFVVLGGLVAD